MTPSCSLQHYAPLGIPSGASFGKDRRSTPYFPLRRMVRPFRARCLLIAA